jgi:predicted phage terminase large subunit-like protein
MGAAIIELPKKRSLETAERSEILGYYQHIRSMGNEWLRRQILKNDRVDILAGAVLGLEVKPFHLAMMRFQFQHPDNLQLAFRGSGKTTTCTVTKTIHLLLKNPNLRILLASKTITNAQGFLKEIKNHFESNEFLAELFGEYYDARKVGKWDESEIEVLPRSVPNKEASVTTVGAGSTVVSKHYDIIISDDLVDEDNSRTKLQRDKLRTWYYQTLDPTLEPPSKDVIHRGEHHRLGTRYHWDDLYGHLIGNELKNSHQIIPALDERGRSPWPEKFPPKFFIQKKRKSGLIIFNAQMQCDTEAMKGEIFQYDDCQQLGPGAFPETSEGLQVFMGVDLAIKEKETTDKFAIVVIGVTTDRSAYYVLDYFEDQLRFTKQTSKIIEWYRRWKPIRVGIETNAYQDSQAQNLKDREPDIRLRAIQTDVDKITRAWKLSAIFEDKRVFFRTSQQLLIEHMVLFPNHRYKDLFDAFELCIRASKIKGRRRRREYEPGVIG